MGGVGLRSTIGKGTGMDNVVGTTGGSDLKDWKTGLILFGILEIILGASFVLMVPGTMLSLAVATALNRTHGSVPPMSAGSMLPGLVVYVLLGTWFIWMGIGSILARRWARALVLVTAWIWLISGIVGLGFVVMFLPDLYGQMNKNGQIPQQILAMVKYVMIGVMTVFYVIIPGVLVLFYGSRHTKATCERRDSHLRWTDHCPLPVLAVSLMAGGGAACLPVMGFYGWSVPFFGVILGGAKGAGVVLVSVLLYAYVAWGTYRLRLGAWWCAVLLVTAWGISNCLTFSRVSLLEFYEKMHFPPQPLEVMKQTALPMEQWMVVSSGGWVVIALIYLLCVRRYFQPPAESRPVPPGAAAGG